MRPATPGGLDTSLGLDFLLKSPPGPPQAGLPWPLFSAALCRLSRLQSWLSVNSYESIPCARWQVHALGFVLNWVAGIFSRSPSLDAAELP
jgi:hypothetical protein